MKTKIFTPLLIALLFVSCIRRSETATNAVQENNEKIEECTIVFEEEFDEKIEIETMINGEEDFRTFLEKFGTDSLFQVSRIVFPLKITHYRWGRDEYGNNVEVYDTDVFLENSEYHFFFGGFDSIEFYGCPSSVSSQIYALMQLPFEYWENRGISTATRSSDNTASVRFFFLEMCGSDIYYFQKNEYGKWYLVKVGAR